MVQTNGAMAHISIINPTNGSTHCLSVNLIDDTNAMERDKTFSVVLSTSDPDVTLGNSMTIISILEDDGKRIMVARK